MTSVTPNIGKYFGSCLLIADCDVICAVACELPGRHESEYDIFSFADAHMADFHAFSGAAAQLAVANQRQCCWPGADGNSLLIFCALRFFSPFSQHAIVLGQDAQATVKFGPQGDVSLYRTAANTLQTDGSLIVNGKRGCFIRFFLVSASLFRSCVSRVFLVCRQYYGWPREHKSVANHITAKHTHSGPSQSNGVAV